MIVIQSQVANTRNYRKHTIKDGIKQDDGYRRCKEKSETIQHITGACSCLAQTDYLCRHNEVANTVHQCLEKKYM